MTIFVKMIEVLYKLAVSHSIMVRFWIALGKLLECSITSQKEGCALIRTCALIRMNTVHVSLRCKMEGGSPIRHGCNRVTLCSRINYASNGFISVG